VIIPDSDHTHGSSLSDPKWIMKGFFRGHNPIYMDPFDSMDNPASTDPVRANMGYTLRYANRIDPAAMVPRGDLASTTYCLAKPTARGAQYLVCCDSSQ
jgi:hypothetical protein